MGKQERGKSCFHYNLLHLSACFPSSTDYTRGQAQCWASQVALVVRNLPASAGRCKRPTFDPWVGKIPWRRAWQPTTVFLPAESHGQRSLVGYSPKGHKESDMTTVTSTHTSIMPLIVIAWKYKALIQSTKASNTEYKVSAWVISERVCVRAHVCVYVLSHVRL